MTGGCTHLRHLFWSSPRRSFVDGNKVLENVPLSEYTTLRVGGPARYFFVARTVDDTIKAVEFAKEKILPIFVLGGGSNILVSDEGFPGVVIKPEIGGIVHEETDGNCVHVTVGAGVVCDDLVKGVVGRGLWGLENLSGIPGTVGAAPIQNIGAYGVEVKDAIAFVDVYEVATGIVRRFGKDECGFGYRDSVFKREKGKYIVVSVTFEFSKRGVPLVSYADLAAYFGSAVPQAPKEVREAVLSIRAKKIPDYMEHPNAGSFFKNPIVRKEIAETLLSAYPDMRQYSAGECIKISAAWLIDHVGQWKDVVRDNVRVCDSQPLVITHDRATARAINAFADEIARDIKAKTEIMLEREVQRLGTFD